MSFSAIGMSSAKTMKTMAPAATPTPSGRIGLKVSTKRKAGTARMGCGRLEKIAQKMPCQSANQPTKSCTANTRLSA